MKNLKLISGIHIHILNESDAVIRMISESRLIDGGAAMLAHINRNHHIERIGSVVSSPFDRVRLRVCVIS